MLKVVNDEVVNNEDYYLHDGEGYKLLPKGMSVICNYYRKKHNLNNMFSVANYNELGDLIVKFKSDSNRFGIVYINTIRGKSTSTHKGSIVVDGDKAFILDSLGMGMGSGAEALKLYLIEENLFKQEDIYISAVKIQKDYTSCGTLSFLFLKEALRMGGTFKEFMMLSANSRKQLDTLPPNLLKYMQSIATIKEIHAQNFNDYSFYPEIPVKNKSFPKETQTLLEYVETRTMISPNSDSKKTIAIAASKIAVKHIDIINKAIKSDNLITVPKETARICSTDPSKETLGIDTPIKFLFTPIKKQKSAQEIPVSPERIYEANRTNFYSPEFNVFNFLCAENTSPIGDSTDGSKESTPNRKALNEITNKYTTVRKLDFI